MPRNKRREVPHAPEVPKRPKLGERSERIPEKPGELKSRCQSLIEVLTSNVELPEDCKTMLLEAIPLTLGVPVKERDKRQVAVAGFIGEVLKEMEMKLLQDLIDSKMSSREEVMSAQLAALRCADMVKEARSKLEEAEEQLALRLSEDDAASALSRGVAQRLEAMEAELKAAEQRLRAKEQERELCEAVRQRLQPDCDDAKGDALDTKAVATLCAKLDLEDSLLSTLPLILQKSHAARSYLERAGSKLLCEALQKHLESLESEPTEVEAKAKASVKPAEREELLSARMEAEKSRQEKLQAVKEAQRCVEDFQSALAKCQAAETQALAKLQDVKQSAGMAVVERQLSKLRKGAMVSYQLLEGPAVPGSVELLEEKLRQLDQQLQQDALRRLAQPQEAVPPPPLPSAPRRRLRPAALEDSELIEATCAEPIAETARPSTEPTLEADVDMKDQPPDAPQEEETIVQEEDVEMKDAQPAVDAEEADDAVDATVVPEEAEVELKDEQPGDAPEADDAVDATVVQEEAEVELDDQQPEDAQQETDDAVDATVVQEEAELELKDEQPADAPQEADDAVDATVVQEEADVELKDEQPADAPQETDDAVDATVVEALEADAAEVQEDAEVSMKDQLGDHPEETEVTEEADVEMEEAPAEVADLETLQAQLPASATVEAASPEESQELASTETDEIDGEADGAEEVKVDASQESVEAPERPILEEEDATEAESLPPTQPNEKSEETPAGAEGDTQNTEVTEPEPMEQESFPETLPDSPPPRPEAELIVDTPEPLRSLPQPESRGSPQHSLFGYATMLLGLNGES